MFNYRNALNSPPDTITYDSDLRPTSITMAGVESLAFTYDAANRITVITNGMDGSVTQSLGYDALNRLTAVTSGAENESYQYDADGNRTSQVINGQTTNFAYASNSNQLASMASPGANATMFGYNADGDTTTIYGHAAYTYGPFERLTNAGATSYVISAEGQRLRKSTGGNVTYFTPGPGGSLLAVDDNNNWMDYVWLNGRPVIVIVNGGVFPTHGDQTGRPLYVSHPNTHAMIWAAQGLPFTRSITTNNFWTFNLGFPGQYLDVESGLWHNGNRDYDADIGRYIESDPIGLAGGVNTYAYVGNNPISNVDPTGLATYLLGFDGSLTFLGGGQISGGVYFNPGLSGQSFGLGVYSSQGAAVGFNIGVGAYVGALNGSPCKLKGNTADVNATVGPVQASVSFGTDDGTVSGIVGATAGVPGGVSVSYSHTESFGVEDIVPAIQRFEFNAMNAAASGGRW